jgi:predicted ArsR family transcriptional regulator
MAKAKSSKSPAKKQKQVTASKAPAKRANTKQAQLIAMLQRPDGATIDEIVKKLEWQSHTVRGAIAGALKKRLKLKVESDKIEGRGRVYRIAT